ncbi:AAA family ATPase [Marinobacter halophilus]|uniref:GTP-binding protein n=1 Tax=Marinobacter halophilus TaxID=1323740 RepID=A0A2T1K976_9GAMM|nr:AAA family ATPase [Marinobacter halophilus]PSF06699.1 GTP-binding protein [Marinobacter halophilus]GGC74810.1 GTP-binding protein [Marinobacter halophilus]
MKLQRLRVEQLRQFRKPFVLDDLQPGLNLVHGPNESGKSTLVRAIRAAFFERYRSTAVDDLRPWGDSAAAPTIELDFEHQGKRWRLTKSFLQRKRCDLTVGTDIYSEDDAEEKLAELLGYQYPKRGVSKAEHWGIPGLLWVEQGTGQDLEQSVEHAGDHLKSALNSLVGEVASSGGDEVMEVVRAQRDTLLTGGGKPRGDYLQLDKDRAQYQQDIAELNERIVKYQEQVDRLGKLTQEFDRTETERPWEEAQRQLENTRERYQQVERLEQQQNQEKSTLAQLQQNHRLLQQNKEHLEGLSKQLAARNKELNNAERALNLAEQQTPAIANRLMEARTAYELADKQVKLARLLEARGRLEQDLRRLEQQQQALNQNLSKAREYQQQVDQARQQARENRIDGAEVKRLKATEHQLNEETIRSRTIATRLSWQLEPGASLSLNHDPLEGEGEKQLLEESSLVIPGVGTLGITPGGEELASTRRKLATLEQTFNEQLKALGVDSVAQAEHRLSAFETAERALTHAEELLKSVAPGGIDPLLAQQSEAGRELQTAKNQLQATPEPDQGESVPGLAEADAAFTRAGASLDKAESDERKHQAELLTRKQARDNASAEWQRLADEEQSPERQQQLRQLSDDLASIEKQTADLEASLASRERDIREARPDLLRQDIERYQNTINNLRQTQEARGRELRDIKVRLEAWGAEGLEEQLNEKQAEFEQCTRRYQELHRRAQALDLLLTLLTEKRQALTRRLQAPLQKHLNHYLSVLFPQATLEVDEQLRPGTFTRGSELGQMTELSFGAREQMGLISRLAYADLLREAGRPTLVILDDTLVHSDNERLEDMKRILFDAASRHQILLFTCHPEKWQDLGVPPLDIQALKEGVVGETMG